MNEPDWKNLNSKLSIERNIDGNILRDDLVWVIKTSTGKFGNIEKARKGDYGIVISSWSSSYGTDKIAILTSDMKEVATTAKCAKIFGCIAGESTTWQEWRSLKLEWIEKTYVPVIVKRVKAHKLNRNRKRSLPMQKYVQSKNGSSILVKGLNSENTVWISKDKAHPSDWANVCASEKLCHSIRIPRWLYEKGGF